MGGRILLVDDDTGLLQLIGMRLGAAGYDVVPATSGEEALILFRERRPQIVVTDLKMGGMDGMTLFGHIQQEAPLIPVIVLTAHGTIPEAVAATQQGIFSFLTKPFDSQELLRRVADAISLSPRLDAHHEDAAWRRDVLTVNLRMEELLRQTMRIAEEQAAALILGPAGCGKRTLAEAIHRAGRYADGPFVSLACTDFPAQSLESMFLDDGPDNILAQAESGVLYIQEVGALPSAVQSRLFTILFGQMQMRFPMQRLIANSYLERLPQLQVIASSRRPLDGALAEGRFRSDLFYLLSGSTLRVPGLADRADDIPLLARHFLQAIRPDATLAPDALKVLQEARWPGNLTQLKNVLAHAVAMSNGPTINEVGLRRALRDGEEAALTALDDARREFERDYLIRLLSATAGNVSQAARIAQRNRTEFYKLLARHALDPVCFKEKLK